MPRTKRKKPGGGKQKDLAKEPDANSVPFHDVKQKSGEQKNPVASSEKRKRKRKRKARTEVSSSSESDSDEEVTDVKVQEKELKRQKVVEEEMEVEEPVESKIEDDSDEDINADAKSDTSDNDDDDDDDEDDKNKTLEYEKSNEIPPELQKLHDPQFNTTAKFEEYYMKQLTREFGDDLDKLRQAKDFGEKSMPVLVKMLRDGVNTFTEAEKKVVVDAN